MYNDYDDKDLRKYDGIDEDYEEDDSSEDEGEEDSQEDSGQAGIPGKGGLFKGVSNFLGNAGKTIKNVVSVINKLPFPFKAVLFAIITGFVTYLIIDMVNQDSSNKTNSSVNRALSGMESQISSGVIKNEDGTETVLTEEQKEQMKTAINFFKEKNSYLYFTISNVNSVYQSFIDEYKSSTNDVGSKLYDSYTTEYGSVDLDEVSQTQRIVNSDQKVPLYIHLLMTEKYNFNAITWKWFGHGHSTDGDDLPLQENKELGLKYPQNDQSGTQLDTYIELVSPYMQTWHIPLAFHSTFLTKSGSDTQASKFTYSIIKNAYSNIIAHRYDIQKYTLQTKFNEYLKSEYKSKFALNIKVSYEYRPKTDGKLELTINQVGVPVRYETVGADEYGTIVGNYEKLFLLEEIKGQRDRGHLGSIGKVISKNNVENIITQLSNKAKYSFNAQNPDLKQTFASVTESGMYEAVCYTYSIEYIPNQQLEYPEPRIKITKETRTYQVDVKSVGEPIKDANGRILYDKYVKYNYYSTDATVEDPELIGTQEKINDRLNNGQVDPTREDFVGESTTVKNNYYVKEAEMFDLKIANEYNYIKYNEADAQNRINAKSEVEYKTEDYEVIENGENKVTSANIGNYVNNSSLASLESNFDIVSGTFGEYSNIKSAGLNTFVLVASNVTLPHNLSENGLEIVKNQLNNTINYMSKNSYIEKLGKKEDGMGTHYIKRVWEDQLTVKTNKSVEEAYTVDDLIEFNADYNSNLNSTSVSEEKDKFKSLAQKSSDSYQKYVSLAGVNELNRVDFINSNSNIYNEYLVDNSPESKIQGYNREWLKLALQELKRLFEETVTENGTLPYKYGSSLGFAKLLKDNTTYSLNSSSGMFVWPTDNPYISCIQGYSARYGEAHGGVDIWGSYEGPNNNYSEGIYPIYAIADGTVTVAYDGNIPSNGDLNDQGLGNYIIIKHDNGYISTYGHLFAGTFTVKNGDRVKKGQEIAKMGSSGNSSCIHLHFNIYDNADGDDSFNLEDKLDPLEFYRVQPNPEKNSEGIQYADVLNDESLRSKINDFNMFIYAGSIGSGEVLPEGTNLPELTDTEKTELITNLGYAKKYKTQGLVNRNCWLLEYYRDNPVELLARAMNVEINNAPETEAGIYLIAAQLIASLNGFEERKKFSGSDTNAQTIYEFLQCGYFSAGDGWAEGGHFFEEPPQFYRKLAAAALDGVLPNPPGFNGNEKQWTGGSDTLSSNQIRINYNSKNTVGYAASTSRYHWHVFTLNSVADPDGEKLVVFESEDSYLKLNDTYKNVSGIEGVYSTVPLESNIDEFRDILSRY